MLLFATARGAPRCAAPGLRNCTRILVCALLTLAICGEPKLAAAQSAELARISTLMQQGKLEEAQGRLERYLEKMPQSGKAATMLGEVCLRQGKFAPALAAYERAAKLVPKDAGVNLALAKLYLEKGNFAKSIEAAGNIPPEKRSAALLPTLAADYFGLKQPEKAGVEIQSMLQVADKQPELVPELAELFLEHGDFQSAQQLLQLAQGKQPATDRLQVDLARTQAGLGQLDAAQRTLEEVLARTPDSLEALIAAGQVAAKQSEWEASEQAFTLADRIAPERPEILYGLAAAQVYANRPEQAVATAGRLHRLAPEDLRATYLLALAEFGARDLKNAKLHAEQVLREHPSDREMHLILVDFAFNEERNLTEARKSLEICLKQNASDPGALYYLGVIQKMEGDVNGAVQSLSRSVAGNPKNSNAQGALGALYLQTGDVTRAVVALEQAVQFAPEEAQNHYQLALAYSRAGAGHKAKEQLELYQQMKAKEAKAGKDLKGPSTSEVPPMGIAARP